jgi:Uncharacterized conserved protein
MNRDIEKKIDEQIEILFDKISSLVETIRKRVVSTVNTAMVYANYETGRYIIEDEQLGLYRAEYGKSVLKKLSNKLSIRFGRGYSVDNLENMRNFYLIYSKSETASRNFKIEQIGIGNNVSNKIAGKSETLSRISEPDFTLSWSHYLVLMRIDNLDERNFYEIECAQQQWSVRQLSRQVGSSLYERLALSRNKNEVIRLTRDGQTLEKASDIIKNPLTLEFLGLKPESVYLENKLENAIISKLQDFLLELGKGFLFESRQKRFTFNEQHFFVDLVFYNRLLQCYVLIDLKVDKLTHQDLGQMQMYVNYFDRYVKQEYEKPTIGILLCQEKNDALVKLTLPKDANIYATEYALYLPDKRLLQAKLKEWVEEYEEYKSERI